MLYLEDYLEMIEHLPQELRDRFTEIREMDLQVQNSIDTLEDRTSNLFLNAKKLKAEQRDAEFEKIREDYYKTLEDGDEKVHMAVQVYELVERYLRRLDQELAKFKMELEADNSGITEVLERRSLELDLPPPLNHNHQSKSEKRKHSMNSYNITNGSEKRLALLSTEKVTPTFVPEINHDPLKLSSVTCHQSSASSPFSSNHGSPSPVTCTSQTTSHLTYGLGHMASGSNAIAAAASQAIAATQQMQQGRRTASLKASFQAVNSTLQGINKEFNFGRDVAGTNPATAVAAAAAVAATSVQVNAANANLMSSSSSSANSNLSQSRSVSPAPDNMVKSSGRQKSRQSKLQHMLMQPEAEAEAEDYQEGVVVDGDQAADWTYDPDEPRYCICNQVSYGDMVACDNVDCPVEWFHYNCVGITQPPRGKWYCPQCTAAMRRRGRK